MKEYLSDSIRNIGLVSHGDVGKTSLAEAMLFTAGEATRLGTIEEGNTISDYHADEIERKISISASLLHCHWNDNKLNLLDTPGYSDFTGEVKGALRVVDSAIVLLDGLAGVEVGTETVWRFIEEYGLPRLFYVTKLDKEHANFESVLKMATERFGKAVLPLQFPINEGVGLSGIVDVARKVLMRFSSDKGGKFEVEDVPAEHRARLDKYYERMVETVAEADDELLEKFFEAGELTADELAKGLQSGIRNGAIFPVLCGAATENIGIRPLLDFVVRNMPSPDMMGEVKASKSKDGEEVALKCDPGEATSALVFKTVSEQHVGELSLFRVYSGQVKSGSDLTNSTRGVSERIGQIFVMNGKNRQEVGKLNAGDIGAVVKLKDTHTGNTLCDKGNQIVLPPIIFPEPVIRVALEPKAKGDEDKISTGLHSLTEEDPTFVVTVDSELRQTIVSGQGELHLEILICRLREKFGVEVETVEPRIAYRENLRGKAEVQGKYKKQTGGRGQYGDVWLRVEPQNRGDGFEFVDAIVGGVVPSKYIPAVEKGVREAMADGVIAGYPVEDVKVTLFDGSYHNVDSSDMAFKIAGSMAFKKAFAQAKPVILEPIYDIEVVVPEDFMGDVMGDISGRRGKILGMEAEGPFQLIKAKVPLAELYRYSTALRSLTQGRGLHRRAFSHYEEVPREIAEKLIAAAQAEKEK